MAKSAARHTAEPLAPSQPPLLPADSDHSQLTLRLKEYLKQEDIAQIWAAYRFSKAAHEGQFRRSGEPYITHPVSVAGILAALHLDTPTLIAALLHDVVEDTGITKQEIADQFGKQVAELVDGLSKLDKIEVQSATEAQAENFRKSRGESGWKNDYDIYILITEGSRGVKNSNFMIT